jgi:hypothetical protein
MMRRDMWQIMFTSDAAASRVAAYLPREGYRICGSIIRCEAIDWDVLAIALLGAPAYVILCMLGRPTVRASFLQRVRCKLQGCAVGHNVYELPVGRVVVALAPAGGARNRPIRRWAAMGA